MESALQLYRNKIVRNLSKKGMSQSEIAEIVDVSQGRVSQILNTEEGDLSVLNYQGAPCKLSSGDQESLKKYLDQGAESHGFEGKIWTSGRVKLLIEEKFGISYHKHHIPRLLKKLSYTLQVPKREDYRRDPEKVEEWKSVKIKEIKKS